jgi:hypothetical protein
MICNEGHNGLVLQEWMEIFVLLPNHFGGKKWIFVAILLFVVILFEIGFVHIRFLSFDHFSSLRLLPQKSSAQNFQVFSQYLVVHDWFTNEYFGLKVWAT